MTSAKRTAACAGGLLDGEVNVSILGDPIALIRKDHVWQLTVCDQLESIADGLPNEIDIKLCSRLSRTMPGALRLHHMDEERALLPTLASIPYIAEIVKTLKTRLSEEHGTDEAFVDELAAALGEIAEAGRAENPEMVGYMLRGYFESHRRHIGWEESVLLPLADTHLTAAQKNEMAKIMARNRAED